MLKSLQLAFGSAILGFVALPAQAQIVFFPGVNVPVAPTHQIYGSPIPSPVPLYPDGRGGVTMRAPRPVYVPGYGIPQRGPTIRDSVLINPTLVNPNIEDSVIVNPTIINSPVVVPGGYGYYPRDRFRRPSLNIQLGF